jgi:hypothetical protein
MGWMIRVLGFNSQQELGIFLFTTVSRMDLRPKKISYSVGTRGSFSGGKVAEA